METLLIRLGHDLTAPAGWCRSDNPNQVTRGPLARAAEAAAGTRVVVLVPAVAISLASAHLPMRQRHRQRQALPFALEEQLATEVEQLHFAVATTSHGDTVHSAVVDRAQMRQWLDALQGAGLKPSALIPDLLTLPRTPGEWSLLAEPDGWLLRTSDSDGIAFEPDALGLLLPLALQQAGDRKPVTLHLYAAAAVTDEVERCCAQFGVKLQRSETSSPLSLLAPGAAAPPVINLLQGEFSLRDERGKQWRPWLPAAVLAGALLLLQAGMAVTRYMALTHEQQRLDRAIDDVYRTTFPDSKRIVDAQVQMQQKLDALRSGHSGQEFTRLLTAAAPALHGADVELRSLRYSPGELDVTLHAASLQQLDQIKQQLTGAGLRVEITGADNGAHGVTGQMSVHGAGK